MSNVAVWIATVGGLGRVRWAPGTWGSMVGLAIGVIVIQGISSLMWQKVLIPAMLVACITFVVCAMICTQAEEALGIHDAPAIILDEVWAMAVIIIFTPFASLKGVPWLILVAFIVFRLFDIVKPFPLQRLARLPRGWGIMADDFGAAIYSMVLLWVFTPLYLSQTIH